MDCFGESHRQFISDICLFYLLFDKSCRSKKTTADLSQYQQRNKEMCLNSFIHIDERTISIEMKFFHSPPRIFSTMTMQNFISLSHLYDTKTLSLVLFSTSYFTFLHFLSHRVPFRQLIYCQSIFSHQMPCDHYLDQRCVNRQCIIQYQSRFPADHINVLACLRHFCLVMTFLFQSFIVCVRTDQIPAEFHSV